MTDRYLTFTEETNALDYLERAAQFIREAATDDHAWKWAVIALHGALYGFAICACKGTDYHTVTYQTKRGDRMLISFQKALAACQDRKRITMTVLSKPLVLTTNQKAAIDKLQQTLRNPFEHYIPTSWHIETHGMPTIAIHCLEVVWFLALEVGNYAKFSGAQVAHIGALVSDTTTFLRSVPLHQEFLAHDAAT
jgi:hypothetical protein